MLLRALETIDEEGIGGDELDVGRVLRDTRAFRRVGAASNSVLWWRRQTAAQLLARVGRPDEDQPLLLDLLHDPHPAVSTAALLACRQLGWPGLVEPLLGVAGEEGPGHRGEEELLQETLAALEADVVPPLLARLKRDPSPAREITLLRIAGALGDRRLRPHVSERLRDGGLEVRIQAARTLAALGSSRAAPDLLRALEDPAWQVRTQAARALARLEAREAAPDLQRALSDPSWWVRLRAALALRRLGPGGREALERMNPSVDRYAAEMADYVLSLDEAAVQEYGR